MPKFQLRQDVEQAIRDAVENDTSLLQEQLGIDHSIPGCPVVNLDPYGVGLGVYPRYIQVALRGEYYYDVFYRGGILGLAVGDELTIKYISEGKRYEVEGPGGSTGVIVSGYPPGEWLAENGGLMDFEPDSPAVIETNGTVTEYLTIAAAIAAANPGDGVVIPPGEYDESITLADGVFVTELAAGTVVINCTTANTAVTTAGGGYINVKEIRVTRSNQDIQAVASSHAAGSCIIVAELIRSENGGTGDSRAIYQTGAGDLYVHAHDVQTEGGNSECTAMFVTDGNVWAWANFLSENSDGHWGVAIEVGSGTGSIVRVWGDCRSENHAGIYTLSTWEGTLIVHGDVYGISAVVNSDVYAANVWGAYTGATQIIYGDLYAEGTRDAFGAWCEDGETQTIYGNCVSTGGTTSIGVKCDDADCEQRVNGDVTGDDYGARCEGGTQTLTNGIATGGTADIIRTGGTVRLHSYKAYTTSGALTFYGHTGVNLYTIGAAAITILPGGAGDVASVLTALYAVAESAGGTAGGTATCTPGAAVNLYNDGVDILTLAVGAGGDVTLQRTAGAATFNVSINMVWI